MLHTSTTASKLEFTTGQYNRAEAQRLRTLYLTSHQSYFIIYQS